MGRTPGRRVDAWRQRLLATGARALLAVCIAAPHGAQAATEDIEFIAEHLPEVAMDNRYATLPVWSSMSADGKATTQGLLLGYSRTGTGALSLSGPTVAVSLRRRLGHEWSLEGFAFLGRMSFAGDGDHRPLRTLAIRNLPLPLPAPATFNSRGGRMDHTGFGIAASRARDTPRLGRHAWVIGAQAERVRLRDYAFDYRIDEGPALGTTGIVDFSAGYDHVTPFAGVEFPRVHGRWSVSPHALLALPLPRRSVITRLSGPGFDLRGDTDAAGNGKHFGDPSLALGIETTFLPWGLTLDLGSTLSQASLERLVHKGIDSNWSLAIAWRR